MRQFRNAIRTQFALLVSTLVSISLIGFFSLFRPQCRIRFFLTAFVYLLFTIVVFVAVGDLYVLRQNIVLVVLWWLFCNILALLSGPWFAHGYLSTGDIVTFSRVYMAYPIYLLLAYDKNLVDVVVIGSIIGFSDAADGRIARITRSASKLGALFDPFADACFFLMVTLAEVRMGIYAFYLALIMLIRYLLPGIGSLVVLAKQIKVNFGHTTAGQASTLAFGFSLAVPVVFLILGHSPVATFPYMALVLSLLTLATFTSLIRRVARRPQGRSDARHVRF